MDFVTALILDRSNLQENTLLVSLDAYNEYQGKWEIDT